MATLSRPKTSAPVIKVNEETYNRIVEESKTPKPANEALIAFIAKGRALIASK